MRLNKTSRRQFLVKYINMTNSKYVWQSFLAAAGTVAYISGVAGLMRNAEKFFGEGDPDTILAPITFLLTFVVSASITGLLVLGRPIHLSLSGLKREAFILLAATIGWLIVFLVIVILILFNISSV